MRYFDLHCDTAGVCYKKKILPDDNSLAASLNKGKAFDEWHQCYAMFVPDGCENPQSEYLSQISDFKSKIKNADNVNAIFTLENATPIVNLDFVDVLSHDGIKAVTLTWNGENDLAGGAHTDIGLKNYGRQVIKALNNKNIAVDLSHLSRKSFIEAEKQAKSVFASHSCCDKTHHHKRNLTDEQINIIASRGGVIGVCFYPDFLGTKYALEGVWRHIYHLLNMGLEDNIAIGSDFDGADMSAELDGVDKIPNLHSYLSKRGLSANILDKIFYKNAYDFFTNL